MIPTCSYDANTLLVRKLPSTTSLSSSSQLVERACTFPIVPVCDFVDFTLTILSVDENT